MAPSLRFPNILYTHNDSGDEARAYAINRDGDLLATFRLGERGRAIDIEDIALVEQNDTSWVYLADIGDNRAQRAAGIRIDRFPEPPALRIAQANPPRREPPEEIVKHFESVTLTYPDGAQDAEAFLVDPDDGALVIITKVLGGWARVFSRKDFSSGPLQLVGEMSPQKTGSAIQYVTAADISPRGDFIGVRTYTDAYLFRRRPGQTLGEALLGSACPVPTGNERQGEALALLLREDSTIPSVLTISEGQGPEIFISEALPFPDDPLSDGPFSNRPVAR